MPNKFEQRLYQIEILLHAYRTAEDDYTDEITALETERTSILLALKYNE